MSKKRNGVGKRILTIAGITALVASDRTKLFIYFR